MVKYIKMSTLTTTELYALESLKEVYDGDRSILDWSSITVSYMYVMRAPALRRQSDRQTNKPNGPVTSSLIAKFTWQSLNLSLACGFKLQGYLVVGTMQTLSRFLIC